MNRFGYAKSGKYVQDHKFFTLIDHKSGRSYWSSYGCLYVPDYPRGRCDPFVYDERIYEEIFIPDQVYDDDYFVTIDTDGTTTYHTPYGTDTDISKIPDLPVTKEYLDSNKVKHYRMVTGKGFFSMI